MRHDLAGCGVCVEGQIVVKEGEAVGADEPLGKAVDLAVYVGASGP